MQKARNGQNWAFAHSSIDEDDNTRTIHSGNCTACKNEVILDDPCPPSMWKTNWRNLKVDLKAFLTISKTFEEIIKRFDSFYDSKLAFLGKIESCYD